MTKWMGNNWKVILAAAGIIATCAIALDNIREMKPKVEANSHAIMENEKSIIKLETIQAQQESNHSDVMEKLGEISGKLRK